MNPADDKLELEHRFGVDGVLYLFVRGRISNERLEEFSRFTDEVEKLVKERVESGVSPVLILTDITGVTHYERKPIAVLRELLSHNKQYPIRSAFVGGNRYATLLIDSIAALLHRSNIKRFTDKESALKWLFAGSAS